MQLESVWLPIEAVEQVAGHTVLGKSFNKLCLEDPAIGELTATYTYYVADLDQCSYNLRPPCYYNHHETAMDLRVRKSTRVLSNSSILFALQRRCNGKHMHVTVLGSLK